MRYESEEEDTFQDLLEYVSFLLSSLTTFWSERICATTPTYINKCVPLSLSHSMSSLMKKQ